MDALQHTLDLWLGLHTEPRDLSLLQVSLRAVIVFAAALVMLRLAHKRFFAGKNAIDVLLAFVLASTLSRAINGSAGFFSTIFVGFLLVVLHNLITQWACRSHAFGRWVKGHSYALIDGGRVEEQLLKKHHVSRHDLEEDLRLNGKVNDTSAVQLAMLERNGDISVLRKPQVFTVSVQDGVQTVRIEIE